MAYFQRRSAVLGRQTSPRSEEVSGALYPREHHRDPSGASVIELTGKEKTEKEE